jgi:predicted RNA polymerase sigma factor
MLLVDARRPARTSDTAAAGKGPVGQYRLQAAIAAVHDQAARAEDTDWPQILALYGLLERVTDNPVVTLNRAVAAGMAESPSAGLAVLDEVEERLSGHYRLAAVRAHLLEMAGDLEAAREYYRSAAGRTTNLVEQRYLTERAARLEV